VQQATLGSSARKQVERILRYLARQEQRTCWSGTAEDSDCLRLAWWTVWFAAYQDSPNPYDAALRKVLGPRYKTYKETHNTLPAVYAGAPTENVEVDGRNGSQWMRSVLAYLDWRSGDAWRPVRDRNVPARRTYTDASLIMRQAFNTPARPPERGAKKQASKSRSHVA
jgi:hypothetical protein